MSLESLSTIRYECTPGGVMVQVHHGEPAGAEWTAMLEFMVARKGAIRAVLVVNDGDGGPSSKQRAELSAALKLLPERLPFVLLTNSGVARGVLTAINWLTRKQDESRVYGLDGLERALAFFGLTEAEKAAVRGLLGELSKRSARFAG